MGILTARHATKARYEARIATEEAAWPREAMQARDSGGFEPWVARYGYGERKLSR